MTATNAIRVMIVDDHTLIRDGLRLLLSTFDDVEVVAMAEDGQQAVDYCSQVEPDVILMDIAMPNLDGAEATARIRADYPQVQVIALTSFVEEDLILRALQAGAISYLLKNVSATQLVRTIRDAARGRSTIDPAAVQALVKSATQQPRLGHDLTDRERDVLALLVEGQTNREIAERLVLSLATVRVYVSNILSKLGASNRTEAVSLALQHRVVSVMKDE